MTRRHITFDCQGATCAATLDLPEAAPARTGLLIVTGGNEIRSGAHRGQAQLAEAMAARGFAVMRYDRRGTGDSEGENKGWRHSADDLAAAVLAFRAELPSLQTLIGFGNCDGAAALLIDGKQAGIDRLVIANPWTYDHDGESEAEPSAEAAAPDAAHAKAHYLKRLANPVALARDLFSGRIDLGKLMRGLVSIAKGEQPGTTGAAIAHALARWNGDAALLLSEADRTAIQFESQMKLAGTKPEAKRLADGSHSFSSLHESDWLHAHVAAELKRIS